MQQNGFNQPVVISDVILQIRVLDQNNVAARATEPLANRVSLASIPIEQYHMDAVHVLVVAVDRLLSDLLTARHEVLHGPFHLEQVEILLIEEEVDVAMAFLGDANAGGGAVADLDLAQRRQLEFLAGQRGQGFFCRPGRRGQLGAAIAVDVGPVIGERL